MVLSAWPVAASDPAAPVVDSELRFEYTAATSVSDGAGATTGSVHTIPFFPTASDVLGRQGFARVVNRSDISGTVSILAFDDAGRRHGPVTLNLDARQTVHFNSVDLEDGEVSKGISEGTGRPSQGDWRLELTSELNFNVLSYIRTPGGFVTSMHDLAPSEGNTHRIAFFNPGSNLAQESLLRLVNSSNAEASVTIRGVDDRGSVAPGGSVRLTILPEAARTLSAMDLEDGAAGLDGSLGDGAGKWRLQVEADRPVLALSMLASPTGHLTNLSTDPGEPAVVEDTPPAPRIELTGSRTFKVHWTFDGRADETVAFDIAVRIGRSGGWTEECRTVTFSTDGVQSLSLEFRAGSDFTAGTVIQGRFRHRNGSSCSGGSPGSWSHIGETTVSGLAPADQASFDARYVGKRVLTDQQAYSLDFVSAGRFRENLGDSTYAGDYTYRNTGPDTGEVRLAYDDGDSCTWDVTFEQSSSGMAEYSCNDGTGGTANWRVVDIPASGAPDLVVESPSVDDDTLETGASFTLRATVRNRGDGRSATTTLRYYRSTNSTISSSDTEVGTDSVGELAAGARSNESIRLTAPSSAGTYYYGACVNSVTGESSTSNNCSSATRVEVAGGGGGGGRAGECVEGATYEPGEGCDVYGTGGSSSSERFSVRSDGRASFGFGTAGGSHDCRGCTINGVRYHFRASHQGGGVWVVDDYIP